MKEKIKSILIGILIGLIAFPTLTLGGTFVVSLIQGKSVEEAVQILAEQIDVLIGRIEVLETKQKEQEIKLTEQELMDACRFAENALTFAQMQTGIIDADMKSFDELISKLLFMRDNSPPENRELWEARLKKAQIIKEQYLSAKAKCEETKNE